MRVLSVLGAFTFPVMLVMPAAVWLVALPGAAQYGGKDHDRILALNFPPTSTWTGHTYGLGADPAEHHEVATMKNLGVKVEVLSYDAPTDLLTIDVDVQGTDGFSLSQIAPAVHVLERRVYGVCVLASRAWC